MSLYDRKETTELPPGRPLPPEARDRLKGLLESTDTTASQIQTAMAKDGKQSTTGPVKGGVLALYFLIIGVLGLALWFSLTSGKGDTFSSSIITAITTIAGFAVGANVTK